ncbi:MAG: TetR/AcrR family transcriptional regulator [Acidimicrobiia bacterium]|nr:TetR/AcrR family transcriptional regulator [Acidimicrobiia bacterium]
MAREPRDRVLAAAVAAAGRVGLARLTVDEVAREAGVGRATVYRWFPGGRDQVVDEAVTWEIGRFLGRLGEAVEGSPDLRSRLAAGLGFAHRALEEHTVLQHLLATEPAGVLPQLHQTVPLVLAVLRDALVPHVEAEPRRRPEVDPVAAAEWLARMFLSFLADGGRWDLDDPAEVQRLVDSELLAGIVTG